MASQIEFLLDEKPWSYFRDWFLPRLFRFLHSCVFNTLKLTTTGVHRMSPSLDGVEKPAALLVIWHDQTLVPLHIFRGAGLTSLMSTSRNGRMFAAIWRVFDWSVVHGSTNKKDAVIALREMLNLLQRGQIVGLTPDGPRGPRHQSHGGAVYLASKTGAAVLPMAFRASNAWILPTWDKFMIPKPFARVHFHIGPPLYVPSKLSREENDQWQIKVTEAINEAGRVAQWELDHRAN